MKKLVFLSLLAIIIIAVGCNNKSNKAAELAAQAQKDSLQKVINERDNDINDMMSTINEIQAGFDAINEAENRVSLAKSGEGANKAQQIRENIKFISNRMKENRELIQKLQNKLRQSAFKSEELTKTIENMMKQLAEKDQQLQALRVELDAKDIHISELDETINNLNNNVSDLKAESARQSKTISGQDVQLNTAWYVFGTKKELKEQRIVVDGKVLQANFNKSYFTKIDIRVDKTIKLYSKYAKLMTIHPSSSYTLTRDANNQYVLNITNPEIFWSTSKYLVVLVK